MAAVRIVTDSACDLTAEEAAELGVEIVPLSIRFGTHEFTDRKDLSVEDFYRRMKVSDQLPETAAPSPGSFETAFRSLADEGAETIVCVDLSSALSGTMQSAQAAATSLDGEIDVRVIDSGSITSGLGTIVIEAATAARDGASADDVIARIEDLRTRTHVFGALDTLDYLKKGGRIGGAQALLGGMLSIKPIIDISTGTVEQAAKPRTRGRAMQWLKDKLLAYPGLELLAVYHGEAPDVDEFVALLEPEFPRGTYRLGKIGAVIGSHGGPGVLGITFCEPPR
ncbi:MAG: DegV family protein [Acidimicrobiales bacterium]|jgi:DegV family protein with EDD domain|nr:DegV family protein [Acidimicrobiales bacterium]